MRKGLISKKSQITIFVIVAVIIIVGIIGVVLFRNVLFPSAIPSDLVPVYDYYLSCVSNIADDGITIMGSHAGYIEPPTFEPGSQYAPFSSMLGFMGTGIPYWYYVSGNGIKKEQIPTKNEMQNQLANYVLDEIGKCDLTNFRNQGYVIGVEDPTSSKVLISDNKISLSLKQKIIITKGESTYTISSHSVNLNSKFGSLYNLAKQVYEYEKSRAFLENYTVDVLYTYAPVSGADFNCSPSIWIPNQVFDRLRTALQANLISLKLQGDYYETKGKYSSYFIVGEDSGINLNNQQVSFVYSSDWPSRFEVWPTRNDVMIAEPVGTQAGLGAMGFCYTPYKFVYDMYFPVLIQIYNPEDGQDLFQFPFAVVINKNVAREALDSQIPESVENVCDNANLNISISTYNVHLDPVESIISFKCLNSVCNLGKTQVDANNDARLNAMVPQCYNGILTAKAEGYSEKSQIISTNQENFAEMVLDREYNLPIEIYIDGVLTNDVSVLITSKTQDNITSFTNTLSYPSTKVFKISEGSYNFDLKVYKSSSITIPATTTTQCSNTPKAGLLGFFGAEEEKCFDVTTPSQTVSNIVYAGGNINWYLTAGELESAKILRVYATSMKVPSTLDEVSASYDNLQRKTLDIQTA